MARAKPTRESLVGQRFGKLTVRCRSDKRGSRGARTVPLWECLCDCGELVYRATDSLVGTGNCMCAVCASAKNTAKARSQAGFADGTQISRIRNIDPASSNASGVRGVYFDRRSNKWRARLKFRGQLMNFGSYENLNDAVKARREAEALYYGEYLEGKL